MPHILIIDSNTAEVTARVVSVAGQGLGAEYGDVLKALRDDVDVMICAPYEGEAVPPLDQFDGVVFTGSGVEWSTDDARAEPLAAVMRDVFAAGLPTLGSCNGMQLAASVLGGSTDASPNGREDGMACNIRLTKAGRTHPMMAGRIDGFDVPCVHRDEVRRLPEGAVLLAGNAHSEVQAFAYETDGVSFWGMQYHPEFTPAFVASGQVKTGRLTQQDASEIAALDTAPEQQLPLRTMEIQNWLAKL